MANDYQTKSSQIRQLASMPTDKLVDHLTTAHPNISNVAPNVAPHIFSTASNAIQFLNSKLPSHGNQLPEDRSPGPSNAEKKAWLDLHDTVNDPVSILNHVKNGTLNSHHLEGLQTVYPDLHQEMANKMTEELGAMQAKNQNLPYSKRLSISKFIGQPLDSTMTPQSYQAILGAGANNNAPPASKGNKNASGKELDQINKVNEIYQTPLQAREAPGKE